MRRRLTVALLVGGLSLGPALQVAAPSSAADRAPAVEDTQGMFRPVTPARLLDSRYAGGKLAPGAARSVTVEGRGGVPSSGVSAVVVNLTVTGGTKGGYLSAYPGGTEFSGTSSLNYGVKETRANLATVPVGTDGSITVLNGAGATYAPVDVIVDVQGYYLDGQVVTDGTPLRFKGAYDGYSERLVDTRTNGFGPQRAGDYFYYGYYSDEGFPPVLAYALNVTAVNPAGSGYLVAWSGATPKFPSTSALNFAKGRTTSNNVVVPSSRGTDSETGAAIDQFAIGTASGGPVNVIVDVVGVYVATGEGEVFRPLDQPERIVDSRTGKGLSTMRASQTQQFTAPDSVLGPDPDNTFDLVGNLTAIKPSAATYLTLYPDYGDSTRPAISNLNPAAGQTVANHDYVPLGFGNRDYLFNAAGSTDVLLDISGYFLRLPSADGDARSASPRSDHPHATVSVHRGSLARHR